MADSTESTQTSTQIEACRNRSNRDGSQLLWKICTIISPINWSISSFFRGNLSVCQRARKIWYVRIVWPSAILSKSEPGRIYWISSLECELKHSSGYDGVGGCTCSYTMSGMRTVSASATADFKLIEFESPLDSWTLRLLQGWNLLPAFLHLENTWHPQVNLTGLN